MHHVPVSPVYLKHTEAQKFVSIVCSEFDATFKAVSPSFPSLVTVA